jgi:hypothetical protein
MPSSPQQLIEQSTRHAAHLERLKSGYARELLDMLGDIEDYLIRELLLQDLPGKTLDRMRRQLEIYHAALKQQYTDTILARLDEQARELARAMIAVGEATGCRVITILTRMDEPLGRLIGNALEVDESIATLRGEGPQRLMPGSATTIGLVATDAALTKAQANKLASLAHHGLSRAIDPITTHDGDTLFALATARAGRVDDLSGLGVVAAELTARAIRRAVRAAEGLPAYGLPAVRDLATPARPR